MRRKCISDWQLEGRVAWQDTCSLVEAAWHCQPVAQYWCSCCNSYHDLANLWFFNILQLPPTSWIQWKARSTGHHMAGKTEPVPEEKPCPWRFFMFLWQQQESKENFQKGGYCHKDNKTFSDNGICERGVCSYLIDSVRKQEEDWTTTLQVGGSQGLTKIPPQKPPTQVPHRVVPTGYSPLCWPLDSTKAMVN